MTRRPVNTDQSREHLDDLARSDAARDLDGQTFSRPFIKDGKAFQLLAVRAAVKDKVIRPDMVPSGRRDGPGAPARHPPPGSTTRDLEIRFSPQAIGSFGAHLEALPEQEHPDAAVTVTRILPCQLAHRFQHLSILLRQP